MSDDDTKNEPDAPDPERRAALSKMVIAAGGVLGAAVVAGPLGVAISPLIRPQGSGEDDGGFMKVDDVARFVVRAPPTRVVLRRDSRDHWLMRRGETLGAVIVERLSEKDFRVLSSVCPHLGCSVLWQADRETWLCPCHKSAFTREGAIIPAESGPPNPSPRPLDPLEWRVVNAGLEVRWVRFKTGIGEREPVNAGIGCERHPLASTTEEA